MGGVLMNRVQYNKPMDISKIFRFGLVPSRSEAEKMAQYAGAFRFMWNQGLGYLQKRRQFSEQDKIIGEPFNPQQRKRKIMKFINVVLFTIIFASPALAEWKIVEKQDRMTGEKTIYATSGFSKSLDPLPFPYDDIKSEFTIFCKDGRNVSFNIIFNKIVKISRAKYTSGLAFAWIRIKYDDADTNTASVGYWPGTSHLIFTLDHGSAGQRIIDNYINKITSSKSVLYEVDFPMVGNIYFQHSMKGADVIKPIVESCGRLD